MVRTNSIISEGRDSSKSVEPVEQVESDDEKDDEQEYEVEAIISHRKIKNKIMYKVSWVGYEDDFSEMPEEDLEGASQLLKEYKKEHNLDVTPAVRDRHRNSKSQRRNSKKDIEGSRRSLSVVSLEDDNGHGVTPRRSTRSINPVPSDSVESRSSRLRSAQRQREVSKSVDRSVSPIRTSRNSAKANGRKRPAELDDDNSVTKLEKRPARNNSNARNNGRINWLAEDSSSERNNNADAPNSSPRSRQHALVVFPSPRIGLFNNLEVDHLSGLKCEGGKKSVKVYYKKPIPPPFNEFDVVDTRFVRHYAPQNLINLYEQLLTAD